MARIDQAMVVTQVSEGLVLQPALASDGGAAHGTRFQDRGERASDHLARIFGQGCCSRHLLPRPGRVSK